jgi:hypothetical protein
MRVNKPDNGKNRLVYCITHACKGGRKQRSAIDAVPLTCLLLDVKGAFDHVALMQLVLLRAFMGLLGLDKVAVPH